MAGAAQIFGQPRDAVGNPANMWSIRIGKHHDVHRQPLAPCRDCMDSASRNGALATIHNFRSIPWCWRLAWKQAVSSGVGNCQPHRGRSEEHTSELQSLMRISYAVFCLKKKHKTNYSHNQ